MTILFNKDDITVNQFSIDPEKAIAFIRIDDANQKIYDILNGRRFYLKKCKYDQYRAIDQNGHPININSCTYHFRDDELTKYLIMHGDTAELANADNITSKIADLHRRIAWYDKVELDLSSMSNDDIQDTIAQMQGFMETRSHEVHELSKQVTLLETLLQLMESLNITAVQFGVSEVVTEQQQADSDS